MKKNLLIVKFHWVDAVTLCGIIFSSLSAVLALHGKFSFSLSFLYLALLTDALDGVIARKLNVVRDFGRYLDGFVDVITYLIVPSLFLYLWGFNTWYYGAILILFIMSGIVRLSVFNEIGNVKDENEELSYLGMPVFWSILLLGMFFILSWMISKDILFIFIAIVFASFTVMMVYNGRFFKFKSLKVMLTFILGSSLLFVLHGFGTLQEISNNYLSGLQLEKHIITSLFFIFPAIVGGSLHMLAVSKGWFNFLSIPILKSWFGANKTWRGVFVMIIFSVLGAFLLQGILRINAWDLSVNLYDISFLMLGLVIGTGYIVFELPNSFIKRRLGIPPGETPEKFSSFFIFLDQIDSAFGAAFFVFIFFDAPFLTAACIVVLSLPVALLVKRVLFLFKWKKDYK